MKKLFIISLIIFCLFILEAVLIYVFSLVEGVISKSAIAKSDDFRFITGIIFMRTVFYFIPQLIIFYMCLGLSLNKGWVGMPILNVITFVLISVLILGIWTNDLGGYIQRPVFYYFLTATFLSPLILSNIPLFKRILLKI
jgi:hypothetical protein